MARFVETFTRFLAWFYRQQKVKVPLGVVKVNLGSGLRVAPGWINGDGSLSALVSRLPLPIVKWIYCWTSVRRWNTLEEYVCILVSNRFVFHNLLNGIPFDDHSIDVIFSSHFLEHLFKEQAQALLREAHRTLKRGGRIRIIIPDLAYAFSLYQQGEKERALDLFYLESCAGQLGTHKYLYDYELIERALNNEGFQQVERCAFKVGNIPDLDILDNRPDQSLYVEAVKP